MDALIEFGKSLLRSSDDDDEKDRFKEGGEIPPSFRESVKDSFKEGGERGKETQSIISNSNASNNGNTEFNDSASTVFSSNVNDEDDNDLTYSAARMLAFKTVKHFSLPNNDFYKYLLGAWKRNLEWREFGHSFSHLRTSNVAVLIEPHQKMDSELGVRYLKWSFGRTLSRNDMRTGYIMKCTSNPKTSEINLEWQYSGALCSGKFSLAVNVAVLNFSVKNSFVTVTYRVVDADTIAVCIVEVDDKEIPTIQYGNMYRIDPSLYQASFNR